MMKLLEPADVEEAKYQMDGQIHLGLQMSFFPEESRKKPSDMKESRDIGHRYIWFMYEFSLVSEHWNLLLIKLS
ncbi:hypothetical protein Tco_0838148 [Tanacetum coccineum]|uniref:Uncharacterized protein n=1 Tax=Tanacetum coccineum TaxID=301880 RepID=A0ABQ5AMZ3_9ASTR